MGIQDLIIETADNCRYCLMCRHLAPVELVTYRETLSPHGWGLLIASEHRGLLEWNPDSVDAIYSAPDNGNSRAHCVTDQPLPEVIAAVRADLVSQGLAPDVVYELNEALKEWSNPYDERLPSPSEGQGEVALFVGDEAQYLWPGTIDAVLKLLAALEIEPVLVGIGRNSGYMSSSLGLPEVAKALAAVTLDELKTSGAKRTLVLSPGDYFTFKQLYRERLEIEWPQEIELVEVTTLLEEALAVGNLSFERASQAVAHAYVDPTHAVRVPDRHDAPRSLLAAVMPVDLRVELLWRRERAHPVGSTALQFTKPGIAERLTRARLEDAKRVGAELIVTEDPGTLRKLNKLAGDYQIKVQGLYELLADKLL
jgi:Fe-S oxidoreductase